MLAGFLVEADAEGRVAVGVDAEGRVLSLRVRHRLLLRGKGDYEIVVPAPVQDVRAAPDSASRPGLRTGQILWAGFSPGRKVLAADAELRPQPAAKFLPVRLRVQRAAGRYSLTVANVTEIPETAYTGMGVRGELAKLLDRTRRESLAGSRLSTAYATIRGPVTARPRSARIAAPIRVEGELRFPRAPTSARGGTLRGRSVGFEATLGDGRPLSLTVEVRAGGTPRLRMIARAAPVVRGLRPPGAASWQAAVRRRTLPVRSLLARLIDARMQLVRADQYQTFLANPDARGHSRTIYRYETSGASAARAKPSTRDAPSGSAWGPTAVALAIAGSVVAAAAAVVLWAHS